MRFMIILLLLIVVVISLVSLIVSIISYNKLVKAKNKVKNSLAHIDTQLQRRFDLLPNLVETIKGFTNYEGQLIEKVLNVRNGYLGARTSQEKLILDKELTSYLSLLDGMIERNPVLKSNAHFLQLQNSLTEIEEDIAYARQFYNDSVTIYNNSLMSFPANLIAKAYGFKEEPLFDFSKEMDNVPMIRFKEVNQCPVCNAPIRKGSDTCEYCGHSVY